ncbi:MAG TPA: hypothetical protein VH950_07575 [Gaiellaceae bacterium]|jgi:hypothetical protein
MLDNARELQFAEDVRCADCGRRTSVDEAEDEGWAVHADDLGRLWPRCVPCADREVVAR